MGKGDVTRQAILEEAARLASQVGLGGLTIGSLATRMQLSKSGLFAHFQSKESLQIQVLQHAMARFTDYVVQPALAAPRGEPQLRVLFDCWLDWTDDALPGGCVFVAAGVEFDDQPGPVRDLLVASQRTWLDVIARVVRRGVSEGHFDAVTDPYQVVQDVYGVMLAYHYASRLLRDPNAGTRARRSFDTVLAGAGAVRGVPNATDPMKGSR